MAVFLSFLFSGLMHSTADIATNPSHPLQELGPIIFFATQACGLLLEEAVANMLLFIRKSPRRNPSLGLRIIGYIWVFTFLAWSGPAWVYPQAANPQVQRNFFLPWSIVRKFY
jgi:hypothetical protein